jgi:hypothetical protein
MTPEQRKHFEFVRDEMHGEPKQEQGEPVAESVEKLKELGWNDAAIDKANTPQQRTWVGLTDDEIDEGLLRSDYALQTAHAWRAGVVFAMTKLKEKNNG